MKSKKIKLMSDFKVLLEEAVKLKLFVFYSFLFHPKRRPNNKHTYCYIHCMAGTKILRKPPFHISHIKIDQIHYVGLKYIVDRHKKYLKERYNFPEGLIFCGVML